ncbi:MAG: hypothetical protein OHK0052_16080 [Anaerolineales bacterium]
MQRGDVFRIPEDEQLYCVEEIAPNGSLYIQRYDLYVGCYGMPLAIQDTHIYEVVFNAHQPPAREANLAYCRINIDRSFDDPEGWSGYEWFTANLLDSETLCILAQSPKIRFVRGESTLYRHHPHNQRLHRALVEQLLEQNWQPILERRLNWYQWTFHRPR